MSSHRVPPRWLRRTLVGLAVATACVAFGLSTATYQGSLGPHRATYALSTDGEVVVDLGPIGTLVLDSPAPLHLGVHVRVEEIPAELTSVGQAQTLDALGGDLTSYLQFFATPEVTVQRVVRGLAIDAGRRALVALLVVCAVGALGWWTLGPARRRELGTRAAEHTWQLTAGGLVVLLLGTVTASQPTTRPEDEGSPVFAGTPLAGARITGRLAGVIDTYGGQLIAEYRKTEAFYAGANRNLQVAWDDRDAAQTDNPVGAGVRAPGSPGVPLAAPAPDLVTLLVISDLHCNTGVAPLIRTAAERSGAQVVLNAGDTTINGTQVEQVCVDAFAGAVPSGVRVVVADGNHDSRVVSRIEADAGWKVLDGRPVEVDGVRILGDRDVKETRIGQGSTLAGERTPEQQQLDLATAACAAATFRAPDDAGGLAQGPATTLGPGPTARATPRVTQGPLAGLPTDPDDITPGVDLLLVHDPTAGETALGTGCVPAQVSGHLHRRVGPEQVGLGVRYVSSSTAGATLNQPTVGPLHGTSEMTVLRFDRTDHRIVDWQLVEVHKDGTADVRERRAWPPRPTGEVATEDLGPGD